MARRPYLNQEDLNRRLALEQAMLDDLLRESRNYGSAPESQQRAHQPLSMRRVEPQIPHSYPQPRHTAPHTYSLPQHNDPVPLYNHGRIEPYIPHANAQPRHIDLKPLFNRRHIDLDSAMRRMTLHNMPAPRQAKTEPYAIESPGRDHLPLPSRDRAQLLYESQTRDDRTSDVIDNFNSNTFSVKLEDSEDNGRENANSQQEHGKRIHRRVSFDLPPFESSRDSLAAHLRDCRPSSFTTEANKFTRTPHVRFVEKLCVATSQRLEDLGRVYVDLLPELNSFLNDDKSHSDWWERVRERLLESIKTQLWDELEEGARQYEEDDDHSMYRRVIVLRNLVGDMGRAISLAKQPNGDVDDTSYNVVDQRSAENALPKDVHLHGRHTHHNATSSSASQCQSSKATPSNLSPALAREQSSQQPPATVLQSHSFMVSELERLHMDLEILASIEIQFYETYRPGVKAFMYSKAFASHQDWCAEKNRLISDVEVKLLTPLIHLRWSTFESFDRSRASTLESSVNNLLSELDGAACIYSEVTGGHCADNVPQNHLSRRAAHFRTVREDDQGNCPRSEVAGGTEDHRSNLAANARSSRHAGHRKGSIQTPAQPSAEAEVIDRILLEQLFLIWYEELQPVLIKLIDHPPEDLDLLCAHRDSICAAIDALIMDPLTSQAWVDHPGEVRDRRNKFFNLVVRQREYMTESCARYLMGDLP